MQLNYKKYGETGEHLIIIHGLFGMLDNWHSLAARFGGHFQVWTLDMRNHGKSPHTHDMSYELMTRDLDEFYTQYGIKEANLIGHSMGGKAAMLFALDYPAKVSKLVVVDIAPKNYPEGGHDELMTALMNLDLEHITKRSEADEALKKEIPSEPVRQFLLKNLTRENDKYAMKMNLDSLSKNYYKLADKISSNNIFEKNTLFIKGGNSDYILDTDKPAILKMFPKAEFITIPSAGHWVHAEAPGEFYEVVIEFLIG